MNATSQAPSWSQQLSSSTRNPISVGSVRAPHLQSNTIPSSLENDRQRYEVERRLTIEAEQSRQYLNALASNRHGVGALPPPPAHNSLVSRGSSKLPPSASAGYSSLPSASNTTYKPTSRNDPGPPPPLLRNDGTTVLLSSAAASKGILDPRYAHLPPTTSAYKPPISQAFDKDIYGAHHPPLPSRRDPSPNPLHGSLSAHHPVPPSIAAAHISATQRGVSPANSISPPDLRRAAVSQQYKYPSSGYSPGSHPQPGVTPPLSLQNRGSPIINNATSNRQRVSSPAAPGQMYGKPNIPCRTTDGRQTFSPVQHPDASLGIRSVVAPPPAHGSSAGRSSSHDHHNDPRNDPRYMLPSTHLSSQKNLLHQQYLPAPTVRSSSNYGSTEHRSDDVPLDLGVSNKRRSEGSIEKETTNFHSGVGPRKSAKLDVASGVLFKVSEPSVLITSEPSTITTVINSALVNDARTSQSSSLHNLSSSQNLAFNSTSEEQQSSKSCGDSESSYPQQAVSPTTKSESSPTKAPFVHKLKKAWIKAYKTNDDSSQPTSDNEKQSSAAQPPPTSCATRTTPSPSLSNRSSTSASSSTITGKRGKRGKGVSQSEISSKPGTPQSINGHSASPRRAGGTKNNKEMDYRSDGSTDSGERVNESSGDDGSISLRSKRSTSVASGGSKKKTKKTTRVSKITKRGRGTRTRNARGIAAVRNRKNSSEESSADEEEMDSSDASKRSDVSTSRKRGRKKVAASNGKSSSNKDEPRTKKERNEVEDEASENMTESNNPFQRPPITQLKKTGESFLQDKPCLKEAPRLAKCRECRLTENQRTKKMANIFCRFYAFRRLKYAKNGQVCVAGFCDPNRDYSKEDDALWNVSPESVPKNLTTDQANFLIENIRTDFDLIVKQERRAVELHSGEGTY